MSWSTPGSATTDALDPSIVNTGANSISAMINFVTLSEARGRGSHYPLQLGGRPQAASLVRGDSPRNAPLQNQAPPPVCRQASRCARDRIRTAKSRIVPTIASEPSKVQHATPMPSRTCYIRPENPASDSKHTGHGLDVAEIWRVPFNMSLTYEACGQNWTVSREILLVDDHDPPQSQRASFVDPKGAISSPCANFGRGAPCGCPGTRAQSGPHLKAAHRGQKGVLRVP